VRIVATADVPAVAREAFAPLGEIVVADANDGHALTDAEVLIVRGTRLDAALLARAGRLRAIARTGAGYDNVDVEAATRLGVPIVYAPGVGSRPVA
jgi:D-3-phosphoglycerate dehydrogenase